MVDAVANSSLRGEMDDESRRRLFHQSYEPAKVIQVEFVEREGARLLQNRAARTFEPHIIVRRHRINPDHVDACVKKMFRDVKTNKPCCSGNDNNLILVSRYQVKSSQLAPLRRKPHCVLVGRQIIGDEIGRRQAFWGLTVRANVSPDRGGRYLGIDCLDLVGVMLNRKGRRDALPRFGEVAR